MKPSHPFLRLLSLMLCLSLCLFAAGCGGSGAAASGSSANAQGSAGGSSAASESQAAGGLPVALQTLTDYGFDYAEEFRNGYAFAVRGNECGYIDSSGNFTVYYHIGDSPYLASIEMSESSFSSSDHMQMWVSEEGLFPWYDENTQQWGYGNIHTGEMVIPALYNAACPFSEGRAVVRWVQEYHSDTPGVNAVGVEPMCQIIDTDGNVICDLSSAFEIAFEGGVLLASLKDGGGGVIDRDGNLIFETELWFSGPAGGLHNLSSTYAELSRSTDPEIITVQSPVVIQTGDAIYDGLKTTYIDRTGAVICTPPEGSTFSYRWNDGAKTALYVADDGSGCGILDQTGVLTEPLFDRFYFPHGGVMIAKPMGSEYWYLYTEYGERLGSEALDGGAYYRDSGLVSACKDEKWGYLNTADGSVAIPYQYSSALAFSDGIAAVDPDGSGVYTYINTNNTVLSGGVYTQHYYTSEEGFYLIHDESGWRHAYTVNAEGKPVSALLGATAAAAPLSLSETSDGTPEDSSSVQSSPAAEGTALVEFSDPYSDLADCTVRISEISPTSISAGGTVEFVLNVEYDCPADREFIISILSNHQEPDFLEPYEEANNEDSLTVSGRGSHVFHYTTPVINWGEEPFSISVMLLDAVEEGEAGIALHDLFFFFE